VIDSHQIDEDDEDGSGDDSEGAAPGGELGIEFINRAQGFALLTNLCIVPVIHWFDRRGEDCVPADAVVCVTGSDQFGWYTVDLERFGRVVVH
jgi:hypothetical protein